MADAARAFEFVEDEDRAIEDARAALLAESKRIVEALLFASAEPLEEKVLGERLSDGADLDATLAALREDYATRGVNLARAGTKWYFRTADDLGWLLRREETSQKKLTRAAIETLAIIAYHQPATRAEIEEIRGVAVSRGTIDQLLELDWVRLGRRRMSPGRPVTFVVTQTFLDHFGLESARDLPGVKELRAAGLLDNRPPPGTPADEDEEATGQSEMFEE